MDLWIMAVTPQHIVDNKRLPWEDLPDCEARFEEITREAGIMIMGFNTYVLLLHRYKGLLPSRRYVVLTKKQLPSGNKMLEFVGSPEEAVQVVATHGERACVIGGKQIIKLFPPPKITKVFLL